MPSSPDEAALSVVDEDSDLGEGDEILDDLHQQMAASEEHIAKLEGELQGAVDQETEMAQRLDTIRQHRATLDQQLHQARGEATGLMLEEASQTRIALLAEADELLEASRLEAEREATQLTKHAFDQAKEMLAEAKRDSVAIVDAGQEEVRALEADAARRIADLDTKHQELTHRLSVMENLYNELRATLKLVAEISIEELVKTRESVKQLDPVGTQGPPPESTGAPTTPGDAPKEGLDAGLEDPSDLADDLINYLRAALASR